MYVKYVKFSAGQLYADIILTVLKISPNIQYIVVALAGLHNRRVDFWPFVPS